MSFDTMKCLNVVCENLKIMSAHIIAQDIMYAKLRVFDYKDKAGKQLVCVLFRLFHL